MSDTIISVEGLGKRYRLGAHSNERYTALRDVISNKARSLFRNPQAALRTPSNGSAVEEFWALRGVSFELKHGEVLGIIGRNGAGKSTLLKILSRITEPTEGRVRIKGRVASLLEVGTGFHPELTGRENIFLNGAILGMTRAEIQKKFAQIVAFAEVEKFLETPVKRYSSGMYVRLAFAVAAHLEPEILVIDEVLAVGDAEFQKKCLRKMNEVATAGRTVLFVTHNMATMEALCERALVLKAGVVQFSGTASDAVDVYGERRRVRFDQDDVLFCGTSASRLGIRSIELVQVPRQRGPQPRAGVHTVFVVTADQNDVDGRTTFVLRISKDDGMPVMSFETEPGFLQTVPRCADGSYRFSLQLDTLPLYPNTYQIGAGFVEYGVGPKQWNSDLAMFSLVPKDGIPSQGAHPQRNNIAYTDHKWITGSLK